MPTESGDKKLLGNFRKLIDEVSADTAYNPANAKLKVTALNTQFTAADAAADAVAAARAPNKLAITERETVFGDLRRLAVRSRNFLKASGASKAVADDAEQFVRKLGGGTKKAKAAAGAEGDGDGTPTGTSATHSSSQMSYDNQVGNFREYIEILKNVPQYQPNEADLKITALTAYAGGLTTKSNAVSTTSAALNQARGTRDRLLYLDDDSIVNTAKLVKTYVQAAMGSNSQLFKKIKPLKFTAVQK